MLRILRRGIHGSERNGYVRRAGVYRNGHSHVQHAKVRRVTFVTRSEAERKRCGTNRAASRRALVILSWTQAAVKILV